MRFTLTTVRYEVNGTDRHDYQANDEVRHGKAHDEHVGHRLQPLLSPDGMQHHSIANRSHHA